MRKLDEVDKQIIRDICNIKESDIRTVSSIIAYLFKADEYALLVYDKIFALKTEGVDSTSIIVLMAKIMSLIDYLQNNGYLYLIPNKEFCFIQDGADSSLTIDTYGNVNCSRGKFVKNDCDISLEVGAVSYKSIAIPEKFEETLKEVICNFVYPTTKLQELVNNDFAFGEELQYKTELKYTKRGLYISLFALFISIASPFWMTCYNNRYAVTTIDSSQISKIVYAIKKLDNSVCANGQLKEKQNVVNDTLVIQRTRQMRLEPIEHKDKVVDDTNNAK